MEAPLADRCGAAGKIGSDAEPADVAGDAQCKIAEYVILEPRTDYRIKPLIAGGHGFLNVAPERRTDWRHDAHIRINIDRRLQIVVSHSAIQIKAHCAFFGG